MPDLKTELKKLESLSFDDPDQPVVEPPPTISTSQATFDYIRDNPGLTRSAIGHQLVAEQGRVYVSVTSLVTQLINDNQVERRGDKYYAIGTSYKPLPGGKKLKKKKTIAKRLATRAANVTAKPAVVKTVLRGGPSLRIGFDTNSIIKDLTIMQAKELRDALNNIFK